jgi:hypothetical protein
MLTEVQDFGGYAYANAMLDGNLEKKQAWKTCGPTPRLGTEGEG